MTEPPQESDIATMFHLMPSYGWPAVGGAGLLILIRFFWPAIRESLASQTGQWRTESGFVKQLSDELDRALQRADEADKRAHKSYELANEAAERADRYFMELADMKTQVKLLTLQLELANEKLDNLAAKLREQ